MAKKEIGHHFLARLGKTRLRPGGVKATNWLVEQGNFSKDSKVLEVACNVCTTSIELSQTYDCQIVGVDMDSKALEKARANIASVGLENHIHVQQGNALKLPFPDSSFDIVINEAMSTMLHGEAKAKAITEYLRVLKPGGRLLTHDVSYISDKAEAKLRQLSQTINANVEPLHVDHWQELFQKIGFSSVQATHGNMTFMSFSGMIRDEGFLKTCQILYRGLQKENCPQFLKMYGFFNKIGKDLRYIAVVSTK